MASTDPVLIDVPLEIQEQAGRFPFWNQVEKKRYALSCLSLASLILLENEVCLSAPNV